MITELNRIKQNLLFKEEAKFFKLHKLQFTKSLLDFFVKNKLCECCIINKQEIIENFYDALFYQDKDCYNQHLCWLKSSSIEVSLQVASLMYEMIEAFITFQKAQNKEKTTELVRVLKTLHKNLFTATSEQDSITFDVSPYMPKDEVITYLHNMYKLGRNMKFILHTKLGTSPTSSCVEQIGQHSAVIKVTDEQMTMISDHSNSFILKNNDDEKNFSVSTKVLCAKENTVILENIKELETYPLLSRRFPRAAIIHASLVHIANEDEFITGNMLDISEGGMGIMSSTKSHFEKGQNIVAFVSYEDPKHGFKFNFEANGLITSIIGKENVFRYGIKLELDEEEKKVIHNLVEILNSTKKESN